MGYIASNFVPILAATVLGLVAGLLYSLVTRQGTNSHQAGAARWSFACGAAVAEFWLACILAGALILAPAGASRWVMAVGSAVVIWIGFVLPVLMVSYGFRGLRLSALFGDALHWLVVMVLQAALLEAIGLTHP